MSDEGNENAVHWNNSSVSASTGIFEKVELDSLDDPEYSSTDFEFHTPKNRKEEMDPNYYDVDTDSLEERPAQDEYQVPGSTQSPDPTDQCTTRSTTPEPPEPARLAPKKKKERKPKGDKKSEPKKVMKSKKTQVSEKTIDRALKKINGNQNNSANTRAQSKKKRPVVSSESIPGPSSQEISNDSNTTEDIAQSTQEIIEAETQQFDTSNVSKQEIPEAEVEQFDTNSVLRQEILEAERHQFDINNVAPSRRSLVLNIIEANSETEAAKKANAIKPMSIVSRPGTPQPESLPQQADTPVASTSHSNITKEHRKECYKKKHVRFDNLKKKKRKRETKYCTHCCCCARRRCSSSSESESSSDCFTCEDRSTESSSSYCSTCSTFTSPASSDDNCFELCSRKH